MSEMTTKALAFFAMASLVGWILLFSGIGSRREQRRREEREHTRASGSIVDYVGPEVQRGRGGTIVRWTPVVEFTAEGQKYRLKYGSPLDRDQHPVGESVDILYDVSDPEHFHLESDAAFTGGAGNLMRAGFIWILFSAVLTAMLAVLVGGATIDLDHLWHSVGRGISLKKRHEDVVIVTADNAFRYRMKADATAVIEDYAGKDVSLTIPTLLDGHPVTGITQAAFSGSMTLTELTVPGIISSVPPGAFAMCIGLTDVTMLDGVRTIDAIAFRGCLSLSSVTLPASVTSIADDAFPEDCAARFHVVEGSEAQRYCLEKGFTTEVDE